MALFKPRGEKLPLEPALEHKTKADDLRQANIALDQRYADLQQTIGDLAYELTENPTPGLEDKVAYLERERDGIAAKKRRNAHAAAVHDRKFDEAVAADVLRRKRAAFRELRRLSGTRNTEARRVAEGLEMAISAFGRLNAANRRMAAAWPSAVDYGPAFMTGSAVLALLQHEILMIGRQHGIPKMPGGVYGRQEFSVGFASVIKAAHAYVQETLTDEAASTSAYVPSPEPEPVPAGLDEATPAEPPHIFTDEEIARRNARGETEGWPLSAREWQKAQDERTKAVQIADGIDDLPI